MNIFQLGLCFILARTHVRAHTLCLVYLPVYLFVYLTLPYLHVLRGWGSGEVEDDKAGEREREFTQLLLGDSVRDHRVKCGTQ